MINEPLAGITGEGVGNHSPPTERTCPRCLVAFLPKRTNQKYCNTACQKAATRNTSRGPRTTRASHSKRLEKRYEWAMLGYLNETYYGTRPDQRLGLLKNWLDLSRASEGALRAALTRPDFGKLRGSNRAHFRRSFAYPPVPYLARCFCRRSLNCTVVDWVHGRANEPETGEVIIGQELAA